MFGRNQNFRLAVALVCLCLGPIGQANSAEKIGDHSQANSAHKLRPSTDAMAIKNSVDSVSRELEAARNKPETANETRRAEQDLKAQKDSANWAMVMGLMALVSTIVGAISLIYLWKTVQYTREAALHARATLHSGRAWMIIKGSSKTRANPADTESGYMWQFNAVNAGNTPALNVKYLCKMEPVAFEVDNIDIELKPETDKFGKTIGQSMPIMGPVCFITDTQVEAMARREIKCIFRCLVEYIDVYEKDVVRETDAWFSVYIDGELTAPDGRRIGHNFICEPFDTKEERTT